MRPAFQIVPCEGTDDVGTPCSVKVRKRPGRTLLCPTCKAIADRVQRDLARIRLERVQAEKDPVFAAKSALGWSALAYVAGCVNPDIDKTGRELLFEDLLAAARGLVAAEVKS